MEFKDLKVGTKIWVEDRGVEIFDGFGFYTGIQSKFFIKNSSDVFSEELIDWDKTEYLNIKTIDDLNRYKERVFDRIRRRFINAKTYETTNKALCESSDDIGMLMKITHELCGVNGVLQLAVDYAKLHNECLVDVIFER